MKEGRRESEGGRDAESENRRTRGREKQLSAVLVMVSGVRTRCDMTCGSVNLWC